MADYPFVPGDPASGVYPLYEHLGPLSLVGPSYRVVPYVDNGGPREYGEPSNVYGPNSSVSSSWSTSRSDVSRDGLLLVDGPSADGSSWSIELGGWSEFNMWTEPVADPDGNTYVGNCVLESFISTEPGSFYAVSPAGQLNWHFSTLSGVAVPATISRTCHIIFGDIEGMIYCLAPDGKQFWRHQISGACIFCGGLAENDGVSYIVTHAVTADLIGASTLYKLAPDGSIEWSRALGGTCAGPPFYNADADITVIDIDGELYSYDATGALTRNFVIADKPSGGLLARPATIRGITIGFATDKEWLRALTYDNSASLPIPTAGEEATTMPAVNRDNRLVFVTEETGSSSQLHLNCYYGLAEEWDVGLQGNLATNPAIDAQNRIYVGTSLFGAGFTTANGISCFLPDQSLAWFHPTGTDYPISVIVAKENLVVCAALGLGTGGEGTMKLIGIRE
jgi:hypothetical protein